MVKVEPKILAPTPESPLEKLCVPGRPDFERTAGAERRAELFSDVRAGNALLTRGLRGETVAALQREINEWYQESHQGPGKPKEIAVDGIFGPKTKQAVREFQKAHQLRADGKVGDDTMAALDRFYLGVDGSPRKAEPRHSLRATTSTKHEHATDTEFIGNEGTVYRDGLRKGQKVELSEFQVNRRTVRLVPEAAEQFHKLLQAAQKDGVNLRDIDVCESHRTPQEQTKLYEAYQRGEIGKAARPGISDHQRGIAVDVRFIKSTPQEWFEKHAQEFGFHRTYESRSHYVYSPQVLARAQAKHSDRS